MCAFDKSKYLDRFKNHVATFTDYNNIKILDFKNPNSNEYRIRFLFEEDYYRLHISGDLGELIARNHFNMCYEKFLKDFVGDERYFASKVECHNRALYCYNFDEAKKEVKEKIEEYSVLSEFNSYCARESEEENLNLFDI